MPSARNCATAGAIMRVSSSPIVPDSPAWGLRAATARRGCGDAEVAAQGRGCDAAVGDNRRGGEFRGNVPQRQVDRHRHHPQARDSQHHHRCRAGKMAEIFGVTGIGEAGRLQGRFVDRIGHHGRGRAAAHQRHGLIDGGDHRFAGFGARPAQDDIADSHLKRQHRQALSRTQRAASAAAAMGMIGQATPNRAASRRSRSGSSMAKKTGVAASRDAQALRRISPPIPAGSPMVTASGACAGVLRGVPCM